MGWLGNRTYSQVLTWLPSLTSFGESLIIFLSLDFPICKM